VYQFRPRVPTYRKGILVFDASVNGPSSDPSALGQSPEQPGRGRVPRDQHDQISQQELVSFRELNQCRKEINDLYQQLREVLIEKLRRGDPVEPGRLSARLHERESRQLSAKALKDILSQEEIERLQDQVEPTLYRYVLIEELS
jgi:hypothetical protein